MAGVILDAGHGGYDNGAQYNGRKEKDDNLRLTLAVGQILEQNGIPVSYTRQSDIYQSPSEKARLGNESGANYFISFHRNASPNANEYEGASCIIKMWMLKIENTSEYNKTTDWQVSKNLIIQRGIYNEV